MCKAGLSPPPPPVQAGAFVTPVRYYVVGVECGFWECVTGVSCHSSQAGGDSISSAWTSIFKVPYVHSSLIADFV